MVVEVLLRVAGKVDQDVVDRLGRGRCERPERGAADGRQNRAGNSRTA
jgi:hypothetical protein